MTKGLSFADLAKERGITDADLNVGIVAKADIIDPAVADAAFALKADEVSAPVKGTFGTVLVQVGKIEPGTAEDLSKTSPPISKRKSPRPAPSPRSTRCATRSKTTAPAARRWPKPPRS